MPQPPTPTTSTDRAPLSRDRVLEGAVALADEIGVAALTIRRLADALDTKPMTIYHHVANKEAILDGMVDLVFAEIDLPLRDKPWKEAIGLRCRSARKVLTDHPWAVPLLESRRAPGPATLGHHDAVLGCFLDAGFSLAMTSHAYALIDAYVYGFVIQESSLPSPGEEMTDVAEGLAEILASGAYPHLAAFTTGYVLQPDYDFSREFDFGLDLILDGLEAHAAR